MFFFEYIDPEFEIKTCQFRFVESFLKNTARDQIIGWHYITDISWIFSRVENWPAPFRILDAGGGNGPLQFLLAEMGHEVTNVDFSLMEPDATLADRYRMSYRVLPGLSASPYLDHMRKNKNAPKLEKILKDLIKTSPPYKFLSRRRYASRHEKFKAMLNRNNGRIGHLDWIRGNLSNMPEIPSGHFDAVVSLSALEHIPIEDLPSTISQIKRVLKPDAEWAITTSGTEKNKTWFHERSRGYCFSREDLGKFFGSRPASSRSPSEILALYRDCAYLREGLPRFYFESDNNGMPWGKWDPQYIPVGIYRTGSGLEPST